MKQAESSVATTPTASPARLSVAMIVRDEAADLAAAIASVAAVAAEVIVVDTGSSDASPAIAEAAGAKVFHAPWTDDFAAARNVALSHCSGDWVLSLDADEVLPPASAAALGDLLAASPADADYGYRVRIVNWRDAQQREATEHLAPRLFPRRDGLRFAGRIHELPRPVDGTDLPWRTAADVVLHHSGYQRDDARFPEKTARNVALLQKALADTPDDPYLHFHHGIALQLAGRPQEAIDSYQRSATLCAEQGQEPEYLPYTWIYRLGILNDAGHHDVALELAAPCLKLCQGEPDYWLNLGIAQSGLGQWQRAIEAYAACLELAAADRRPAIADAGALTWKPLLGIGAAYLNLGDRANAEDFLRRTVALQPRHTGALQALVQLSLERQDSIRAELDMRHLLESCQGGERCHVYRELTRFLLTTGRAHAALELLEKLILEEPYPGRATCLADLAAILQEARLSARLLRLLQTHRLRPGIAEILAHHYAAAGDHAAVAVLCDDLLAAGTNSVFALGNRGLARYRQGDLSGAIDDLRQATGQAPEDAELWAQLGTAYLAAGQADAAETCMKQAIQLQPGHLPASLGRIELALERQQLPEAAQLLDDALAAPEPAALRKASSAIAKLLQRCDQLFAEQFTRPGPYDPMVLSRMIDRLNAAARP